MTTFMQIEPQPARGAFTDIMFEDGNEWYFEEKHDGDRRLGQFIDGVVRLTGRRKGKNDGLYVEKTNNLPHIAYSLATNTIYLTPDRPRGAESRAIHANVKALEGTVLDGEMMVSPDFVRKLIAEGGDLGGLSKHVTSIMGSHFDEAIRKQQERGWMVWVVFDCLYYKGMDIRKLGYSQRRIYAAKAVQEWNNPYVSLGSSTNVNKKAFLEGILAKPGGEGVIAKHRDAFYGAKSLWAKRKVEETADVVVIGFDPPKEYSEKVSGEVSKTKFWLNQWIGAVRFGQYRDGKMWECGTCSGMDEGLRADMSLNKDKYLGKVCVIKFNGREPTGKFRHPQFKGLRDDKSAEDCVYNPNEA